MACSVLNITRRVSTDRDLWELHSASLFSAIMYYLLNTLSIRAYRDATPQGTDYILQK